MILDGSIRKPILKIHSLQILRAIAAWMIVYHHYMQSFYQFKSTSIMGWFFSYRGSLGVDIFFVISGFVMYLSLQKKSVSGSSFFIKRLIRVVPAYWFFSFVLLVLVLLSPEIFPNNKFTADTLIKSMFFIPHHNPSDIGVRPFLTVGWTLNYEVLFYTMLSLCIFMTKRYAGLLCSLLVISLSLLLINQASVLFHIVKSPLMLLFVIGIFIGWIYIRFKLESFKGAKFGVVSVITASIVLSGCMGYSQLHKSVSATLIVFGFILFNHTLNKNNTVIRHAVNLGDYSYSTYLCHAILIRLYLALFGPSHHYIYEVILLATLTIIIYFISHYSYFNIENSAIVQKIRSKLLNITATATLKANNL